MKHSESVSFSPGFPSLPPEEIISSHMVEQPIQASCNLLCFNVSKCVGFNFRTKLNEINCQLTNTTKKMIHIEEGEWTLFVDVDAVGLRTNFT